MIVLDKEVIMIMATQSSAAALRREHFDDGTTGRQPYRCHLRRLADGASRLKLGSPW